MPIRDRVNLAKFGLWASQIMGWKNIPTELLKIASFAASVAEGGAVALTPKPKSQRQENNDLRLIWALRTMLSDNDIYPKNTQLIDDLCELHKGKEPFKKSTLETRFSDARKISESD